MEELERKIADLQARLASATAAQKPAIQAELDAALDQLDILKEDAASQASPEVATPRNPNEMTIRVSKARQTQSGKAYVVNNLFLIPVRNAMEFYLGSALALEGKSLTIVKGPASTGVVNAGQTQLHLATIQSVSGMEALAEKESEKTMEFMLQRRMTTVFGN